MSGLLWGWGDVRAKSKMPSLRNGNKTMHTINAPGKPLNHTQSLSGFTDLKN